MNGKLVAKAVADCMAGKANSAMLLLPTISILCSDLQIAGGEPVIEAKSTFDLINSRSLAQFSNIVVKCRSESTVDKFGIGEYESFLHVEAYSYNVHSVLDREFVNVFKRQPRGVVKLLIVRQHDNQWNIKDILQIP